MKHQFLKNKSSTFLYWLIVLLLISCTKTIDNPIEHFAKSSVEKIKHSKIIYLEDFGVLKPVDAIYINSDYIIWDDRNENMFNIIDMFSKKTISGVNKGNGPQDIISPSSFQSKNDEILIYDISQKKISKIDILSDTALTLKEVQRINFDKRIFMINCIDSNFVATGIFEDYWLANINTKNEIISKVSFPLFEETKSIPKMQLSMLYISTFIKNSPDNKKIVAATQKHGLLYFFNYTNEHELKEYKQLKYYAPKFEILERGNIAFSKDNKIGFCAVDCDNDFVYTLYSGKTFNSDGILNYHCDNLLIYDWEGNPLKHYILDIPLYSMKYNKEQNTIYGIAYNPEGVLIEYKL